MLLDWRISMGDHKVLITTSGLGTRLGNLTDNTNKCLVRITDKPSISHIIEYYPEDTEFVISLGYHGDLVRQFLNLTYPKRNFTFVEVDKFMGEGSSLGYSILQCRGELNCPFIFHASDTIIRDADLPDISSNWMAGTQTDDASHYRTLITYDDEIEEVNEKGEINYDSIYIGVAGIRDYEDFFEILEDLVTNDGGDLSDVHVIIKMMEDRKFYYGYIPYNSWFDVGNVSELNRARLAFESNIEVLDKTDESIFFFDDFVVKFFANKRVNKNRVIRGKILEGLVPNIINYTDNFYKYKKVKGNLFSKTVNEVTFRELLEWAKSDLWKPKEDDSIKKKCYEFYITKTMDRLRKYLVGEDDKEEMINGESVPNVYKLLNKINMNWLTNGTPTQFHGDFILDNIIETSDGFSLIDWRQDFGGDVMIGDMYYDLAKLNHNLTVNHDIVGRRLFNHRKDNCYILTNSTLNSCKHILKDFCINNGYDYGKVQILTSIIWLNMSPLHEYPFNDFLFTFGKYNLYKTLKEWKQL
jgi:NDP-sugar pyrophosphorylase family protein